MPNEENYGGLMSAHPEFFRWIATQRFDTMQDYSGNLEYNIFYVPKNDQRRLLQSQDGNLTIQIDTDTLFNENDNDDDYIVFLIVSGYSLPPANPGKIMIGKAYYVHASISNRQRDFGISQNMEIVDLEELPNDILKIQLFGERMGVKKELSDEKPVIPFPKYEIMLRYTDYDVPIDLKRKFFRQTPPQDLQLCAIDMGPEMFLQPHSDIDTDQNGWQSIKSFLGVENDPVKKREGFKGLTAFGVNKPGTFAIMYHDD